MRNRLPLVFILMTLLIDSMGIGLIIPVMPDLIEDVTGGSLASAAVWGGILTTSFAVMQFFCAPTLGSLSDRFGRRPVLFISLGVLTLDYVIMALAGSIWMLLLGRILGGIAAATQSVGYAFIADISAPEEKARRFGLIGAAFGLGFVLGPILGGELSQLGPRAPFWAAAILAGLNLLLGILVLPETVTDKIRRPFQWSRANPFGSFAALSRLPGISRLIFMFFVYQVAFTVYPVIWAFYTKASFGWDGVMTGRSLAMFGVSMALVQGVLIGPILKRYGEVGTILRGLAFNALAFLSLSIVTNEVVVLMLVPLTALGAVVVPALQGLVSKTVGDDEQGEAQGLLSSAMSLAMVLSPLLMTNIFYLFTNDAAPIYVPGAPFLVSMVLMGVCAVIFTSRQAAKRA